MKIIVKKHQGVAQRHAERTRQTHGHQGRGAERSLGAELRVKRTKRHVDGERHGENLQLRRGLEYTVTTGETYQRYVDGLSQWMPGTCTPKRLTIFLDTPLDDEDAMNTTCSQTSDSRGHLHICLNTKLANAIGGGDAKHADGSPLAPPSQASGQPL